MDGDSLSERMFRTARHLEGTRFDTEATIRSAIEMTKSSVDGCDAVSISVLKDGHVRTLAATDHLAWMADLVQSEHGEGPCSDVLRGQACIHVEDLDCDERWPTWRAQVGQETGVASVLSLALRSGAGALGALNLYATKPHVFTEAAVAEATALAAQISSALSASRDLAAVATGLAGRRAVGQATGILMERFDIGSAHALSVLTSLSSEENITLRSLAEQLVGNRTHWGADRPRRSR